MLIFSYFVIAFAELLSIDIIAKHLLQCKRKQNWLPQILWGLYIIFSVVHVTFHYSVALNNIVSILLSFIVSIGYHSKWSTRIAIALLAHGIGTASEGILSLVIRGITGLTGTDISPDLRFFSILPFIAALFKVTLAFILFKTIRFFQKKSTALYTSVLWVAAILLTTVLLLLVTFADTAYLPAAIAIIILILVAIALCAGMYRDQLSIQQERLRLEFLEQQSHDQLTHYTALYENSNEVHKIRHDLKNFIIGVRALAAQKDYDGLEAQLEQFQESVQPHALVDTGNPVLDAVLTAKQTAAPNIEFQMNIVQLNCQHIDPMDVAMLAASALDNAVEGCANISSPYIEISVQRKNEMISLLVKNPTTNKPEVKRGRIVTTKPDPERHGYGILGMQRIVDKYDGNLRWSVKDGEFILSIFLQDKPMIKT